MTERITIEQAVERADVIIRELSSEDDRYRVRGIAMIGGWADRTDLVSEALRLQRERYYVPGPGGAALERLAYLLLRAEMTRAFDAGAQAERANSVTLLRRQADYFEANEQSARTKRWADDASLRKVELRHMADRIGRGERAEGH